MNQKYSSIVCHAVGWLVEAGIIRVGKVHSYENIANEITKQITVERRNHIFGNCKY